MATPVHVIGGGLAGVECAYQLAERGRPVRLWEMRPQRTTAAHQGDRLAELVCSNSLRSDDPHHAAGLLKREMECFDSLVIRAARNAAVPAGSALAVDRELFAASVTEVVEGHERIEVERREVRAIPEGDVVVATGPLTSEALTAELEALLGTDSLFFYDAIAPIVEASSLDHDVLFAASRWGRGEGDDYLNAAMNEAQYLRFREELVAADVMELHSFEKNLFFEGCLPIEEMARRGVDTLRFGPLKPVGIETPGGGRAHALVQLRRENLASSQYNLVGFQSRLKWPEQRRLFRTIPGLERARFVRLGQVHRNTFVNAPLVLDRRYRVKAAPRIRLAGQLTGVEGYLESAATGLAVALYLTRPAGVVPLPPTTALGSLSRHLVDSDPARFQPANVNYGLFPDLGERVRKRDRRRRYAERAKSDLLAWSRQVGLHTSGSAAPRGVVEPAQSPAGNDVAVVSEA